MPAENKPGKSGIQEVRLQRTSRLFVSIMSSCLLVFIPLLLFLSKNAMGSAACGVGFLVTLVSLVLINRGKSRLGTGLTLFILLSLMIPVGWQYIPEPELLPAVLITIVSLSFLIILPAGILVHRYYMVGVSAYFGTFLGLIMYKSSSPVLVTRAPVILASYVFVCILVFALTRLQDSLLQDTEQAAEEAKKAAEKMRSVIDEIGSLKTSSAGALSTTKESIGKINAIIGGYIERVNELSHSSSAFGEEMEETRGDLERLSNLLDRSKGACASEAELVEAGAARNREMLAAADRIAGSVRKADEFSRDLHERTVRGMRDLESSLRSIHGLHEYQSRIEEIVGVISDVSARTALLSINASIEAAHSGSTGKGFKVVADEIKKLAEQSALHTKNISEVVSAMVGAIDTSIASARQVETSLADIVKEIEEFRPVIGSVVESSESLQEKNRSMNENFSELSKYADIVDSSTEESGRQFRKLSDTVSGLSGYFASMSALASSLTASNEEASRLLAELQDVSGKNERVSEELDTLLRTVSG